LYVIDETYTDVAGDEWLVATEDSLIDI